MTDAFDKYNIFAERNGHEHLYTTEYGHETAKEETERLNEVNDGMSYRFEKQ